MTKIQIIDTETYTVFSFSNQEEAQDFCEMYECPYNLLLINFDNKEILKFVKEKKHGKKNSD